MKLKQYFKTWHFERYFRLAIAILAGIFAVSTKEYSVLIITAWLGALALFNISCCGTSACNTTAKKPNKKEENQPIQINYDEIK